MNTEVISDKQGISLIIMFIVGTSIVLIMGVDAKQDLWLANIFAVIMALPMVLIYSSLHRLFPKKDLFDILEICMGRFIGKIIILLYSSFAFFLSSLIVRDFGEFFVTVAAPETPMIVPMFIMALLGAWIVIEGIETMGRWAEFFLPVTIVLLFITVLLLIPQMKINNIRPMLYSGIKPVIKGAFGPFSFPFAETVIFTMVFSTFKTDKSSYKVYLSGLLIGGIIIVINSVVNIFVLGIDVASTIYFPFYATLSRLNIGDFLQRLQIVIAFIFLLGGFIKLSICLLAASKGISKLFGYTDYRFIVLPFSLLLINLSYLITDSLMYFIEWDIKIWPYYAFLFQVILPIIIFVAAKVKAAHRGST